MNCTKLVTPCNNEVNIVLGANQDIMLNFCNQWHTQQTAALKAEQTEAREMLCATANEACNLLSSQIQEEKDATDTGFSCANVAAEASVADVPECDGDDDDEGEGGTSGTPPLVMAPVMVVFSSVVLLARIV